MGRLAGLDDLTFSAPNSQREQFLLSPIPTLAPLTAQFLVECPDLLFKGLDHRDCRRCRSRALAIRFTTVRKAGENLGGEGISNWMKRYMNLKAIEIGLNRFV
jgi:hypothetical protein